MKPKAPSKAVSYLRCSGLGQVNGDTWERQTTAIAKYAKRHGIEVVDEFRDAGVSGTKDLDNRPGLAALLDRVESNGVKIVLVENATRLALLRRNIACVDWSVAKGGFLCAYRWDGERELDGGKFVWTA